MKGKTVIHPTIVKVKRVTVTPEGRTEHELTGKELEDWMKENGYLKETKTGSDTE
ncbi:MAG: hypothetical protein IIZ78_18225 [Clostridiales bacterium]|nr:hypothetical protein [Clostridiales bacterium]